VSEASDVLLESTPKGLDVDALMSAIERVPGVDGVHDVHAWSLSSDVRALSAHLVMSGHPTLEEAQSVAGAVKREIAEPFSIAHATFELECESCVDPNVDPCAIDGLREATG
jgi:cobalt-zinc-cadmium efflux system protein